MVAATKQYRRALVQTLVKRIHEPRHFLQVLTGPRQTGKTTVLTQALAEVKLPWHFADTDAAEVADRNWLRAQWEMGRALTSGKDEASGAALLVIDEVQNISQWSRTVKALWDEDARAGRDLRVVLSGSSTLLLQSGLSESLMGRFEVLRSPHWTLRECQDAFGYTLDDYLCYGGYPGSAFLHGDLNRWRAYLTDAIIEATLSRDVLALESVRKPAVLRALFKLGASFSAQELSYRKILGQLDDAGNTSTVAHYLDLLGRAGLLCGLQKYSHKELKQRASSPRLLAYDPSLIMAIKRARPKDILADPEQRGHITESAVGAYLLGRSATEDFELFWWREGDLEVDYVVRKDDQLIALEVKSGRKKGNKGLPEFVLRNPGCRALTVGSPETPLEEFLAGGVALF
ncbi:MAG: ATP-binding protein [Coriobacteriia bacterium]|nr:ATP-binding protein [Coriobacteriia bacterium]